MSTVLRRIATLGLIVGICISIEPLYGQNRADFFRAYPVDTTKAPTWAKLMYASDPDVPEVIKAYDRYFKKNPYTKTTHTQNFKQWIRTIHPFLDKDGKIGPAEKKAIKGENERIDQRSTTGHSMGWTAMGPFATYTQGTTQLDKNHKNVYAIDRSLSNPNFLICGTEAGGVFKSVDKGQNWTLMTKDLTQVGSNTAVKIHPTNTNILLFASGNFIFKSADSGNNWVQVANTGGSTNEIKYMPNNPNVLFSTGKTGLFRSNDGGDTWNQVFAESCWDVDFHPTDSNVIYILKGNTDSSRCEVFRSDDGGNTWLIKDTGYYQPANAAMAKVNGGKLGVTPASPDLVYVCLIGQEKDGDSGWIGVYKSTDKGENWTNPANQNGGPYGTINGTSPWNVAAYDGGYHQGFFNFDLEVSSTNPNKIWVATIRLAESSDGGATFKSIGAANSTRLYNIHADVQDLEVIGDEIWISTDGGINFSTDELQSAVVLHRGIQAGHFWGFNTGWNEDTFVGGRYHDGTTGWYEGYGVGEAHQIGGVEEPTGYVHPIESRKVMYRTHYASPNMSVQTLPTTLGGSMTQHASIPLHPNEHYFFGTSSEVLFDPRYANHLYIGRDNKIYKSTDSGASFTAIHSFANADAKVYDFAISRKNPDYLYCVLNPDGGFWTEDEIWKSTDGGNTWIKAADVTGANTRRMTLSLNPANENEVWIALVNGGAGQKVYRTTDGGSSWTNMTGPVLNSDYPRDILFQGGTSDQVYLACQNGFYSYQGGSGWQAYDAGLPAVASSLKLNPFYRDSKLRLATAGRGIWGRDMTSPSSPIAQPITYSKEVLCPFDTVRFDCYSMLDHTGAIWNWSFNPAPTYISSATSRNPKVVFGQQGSYDVTLTVSNPHGTNTKTVQNMIQISKSCTPEQLPGLGASLTGGSDSYGKAPEFTLDGNTYTFTAWIKRNGNQNANAGLIFVRGGNNACGLNLGSNNELRYHWNDSQWWWNSGLTIPDNRWTHVALVIEAGKATLYMNGEAATNNATHPTVQYTTDLAIGADFSSGSRRFKGEIDEVTVWNRALTMQEIRTHRHLTKEDYLDNGLVAYYQFNDTEPNIFIDRSKYGKHGILTAASAKSASTAPVGGGVSSFHEMNAANTYIFGSTGVRMQTPASGTYPSGRVYVSRLNLDPNILAGQNRLPYYWIINNYGSGSTFSPLTSMKFDPHDVEPSSEQVSNPSHTNLIKREDDNEDLDTWTSLCQAENVTTGPTGYYGFGSGCNINSFSQFSVVFGAPSPVDILSFEAKLLSPDKVKLEWKVTNQEEIDRYEILRSIDGITYETIGSISAKKPVMSTLHYAYTDNNLPFGKLYYRLKSVDIDDTKSLSSVAYVYAPKSNKLPYLFPNPSKEGGVVRIDLGVEESGRIRLYDINGKLVIDKLLDKNQEKIDIDTLASGTYLYSIQTDTHIVNSKLIIQ